MTRWILCTTVFAALSISAATVSAQTKSGLDKLYILNCGEGVAGDISRWSGVDVGKSVELSGTCYLIHHTQGWLLDGTASPRRAGSRPG